MKRSDEPGVATLFWVWAGLMALLALSVATTYLPLSGAVHLAANLGIAVLKMLLVILFFMHVRYSSPLIRLIAFASFFWIALLIGLTLVDNLTRTPHAAPW